MYFSAKKLGAPEKKLSDFGDEYYGYYCDSNAARHVGYLGVVKERRGNGLFHVLLESLKRDVDKVVLYNPKAVTQEVAGRHEYLYDEVRNVCVWKSGNNF